MKINEEGLKQYDVGFLEVVDYLEWLGNIMPVPKKDGKVRMFLNRDLNKASPKNDFHLPHIDVLVDNAVGHAVFSFMNEFSGYNQIKMITESTKRLHLSLHWGHLAIKSCRLF